MAEVLGRYAKLSAPGARATEVRERALRERRAEPWVSPEIAVTVVRRMSPDQVSAMVADYRSGIGSWRLATKYGVASSTVLDRLKAAGVELDVTQRQREELDATTRQMAQLRAEGWTLKEIGEKFGITRQAVSLRLSRHSPPGDREQS